MKRRSVLRVAGGVTLGAALPVWPQTNRVARLGVLANLPIANQKDPYWFRHALERLGWEYGRNIDIETRFAVNDPQKYRSFAEEFAAARMDVIFAGGDDALEAAFRATKSIPIVMIAAAAVETGYAKSMSHPGGNVTGVIFQALDLIGKSFELLRALRPDLQRIGIARQPGNRLSDQWLKGWQAATAGQGVSMVPLPFVRTQADIDLMLGIAKREAVQALVGEGPVPVLLGSGFDRIQAWAIQNKVLTFTTTWIRGEHLVSFGPDIWDLRRIAIGKIDRILRGASPGDIPIEQPTKFELIINRKFANAMGLKIPQTVLLQATEVIE